MLTYPRWKYAVFLIILLLSAVYAVPNIFPQDPSVQVTANRGAPVDDALRKRVADSLKAAGVAAKEVELDTKKNNLLVRLSSPDLQVKAADTLRPQLGSDYIVALNIASTVPDWLEKLGARPMSLGLDLQGGVHFLMQVDQKAALEKRLDATAEDMRVLLRDNRVGYESVDRRSDNSLVATLKDPAAAEAAREVIAKNQPLLQLQVQGNALTVRMPQSELQRIATEAI